MSKIPSIEEIKASMKLIFMIQKLLESTHGFKIESRETTISIPERTCQDDIAVKISHPAILARKMAFDFPGIIDVGVHALGDGTPPMQLLQSETLKNPSGFILKIGDVPKGVGYLLFKFEYEIASEDIGGALVRTDVQPETYGDTDTYWLHACLKHPDVLKEIFRYLQIKDLEFGVDVAVGSVIKSAVPTYFVNQLTALREIASWRDHSSQHIPMTKYIQARRRLDKDPFQVLSQLQFLMSRDKFRTFVDIPFPYRYYDCELGADYEVESKIFPNAMKVINRTNLSLKERQAANGTMIFKKKDFHNEVAKLFE
jgi:hypothetical protein